MKGTRCERRWRVLGISVQYAEAMEAGQEPDWDFDWRYAAIVNRYDQLPGPETLVQLRDELWQVLRRYHDTLHHARDHACVLHARLHLPTHEALIITPR